MAWMYFVWKHQSLAKCSELSIFFVTIPRASQNGEGSVMTPWGSSLWYPLSSHWKTSFYKPCALSLFEVVSKYQMWKNHHQALGVHFRRAAKPLSHLLPLSNWIQQQKTLGKHNLLINQHICFKSWCAYYCKNGLFLSFL